MRIRLANPDDHELLLEIWLRSVRATHRFLSEEEIQNILPLVRDGSLKTLELWVLVDETDTPIGFMGLRGAKLEVLFIAPEFLRQGGGTMLVEHARTHRGPLSVDVNEQNLAARTFYEALGFVVQGRSDCDATGRQNPLLHLRERYLTSGRSSFTRLPSRKTVRGSF